MINQIHRIIVKLNKILTPYYALLITLGFFVTTLLTIYKYFVTPTDLKVVVKNEEMQYPSSIAKIFKDVYFKIPIKEDSIQVNATQVYSFLLSTNDLKTIIIENVGEKTLRNIKFKHLNADAITAYSINSDIFNNDEEKKLYENLIYDQTRGLVYLKQVVDLPPKSTLTIRLWGNFKKHSLIMRFLYLMMMVMHTSKKNIQLVV